MGPHAVFVCTAPADTAEGERFATALRVGGLDVWYDRTGLQVGSLITDSVEQQLRQRTALVLLVTPASVRSHWVKLQIGAFLALMEEDESRVLLPVRVGACDIPLLLQTIPWIEAQNRPFEEVLRELAHALGSNPDLRRQNVDPSTQIAESPVSSPHPSPQAVRSGHAHVFAIANPKGRVGKTTTTINLAACLADAGYRTLVIDLSPNSEATTGFGVDARHISHSIFDLLVHGTPIMEVMKTDIQRPNLALLPATVDLYAAEYEWPFLEQREFRLKNALAPVKSGFDFILIDCPSWLGMLTINGLTAADGVLLPLQCEYFALEGMQQLLNTIRLVRDRLNPTIILYGVILTMFDPRTKLGSEVVREISEHFPKERFQTVIPRTVRLAEAPSFGQTILEHDPRSPGAVAYKQLAEEVIARSETMEAAHA